MPYLMVDLNDVVDCRQAIRHLKGLMGSIGQSQAMSAKGPVAKPWKAGRACQIELTGSAAAAKPEWRANAAQSPGEAVAQLPLRMKLARIMHRGLWQHLVAIAQQGDVAKSLAEYDRDLQLTTNKMRSLKAIMAKLENRFDLRFLQLNEDAGCDDAGNPRYSMPCKVRKQILRLSESAV